MLIFFLLSLGTMIAFTYSVSELMEMMNFGPFSFEDLFEFIKSEPIEDIIPQLGLVMWALFQIYGIPLIVFLVSFNGLMQKKRVIIKKGLNKI